MTDTRPENGAVGVSVAEAARQLAVSERTLRRVLKQPDLAARTLTADRQTATGRRQATILPPDLVADLHALLKPDGERVGHHETPSGTPADTGTTGAGTQAETPADAGATPADAGATPADTGTTPADAGTPGGVLVTTDPRLLAAYEALVREKDARIGDLAARVAFLEAALKREQESVARAQGLKAIEATASRSWWSPWSWLKRWRGRA